ncbi:MAG: hypothetical protein ACXWC4_06590 [Telluria sp.]
MFCGVINWRAASLACALVISAIPSTHAAGSGSATDQGQYPPAERDSHASQGHLERGVRRVTSELEAHGYEVARGSFKLFTVADCKYSIAVIGNCMGNNPAAPYVIPALPRWPDEYDDKSLAGLLGPYPGNDSPTFRLDKREAVVIVGQLPPPARYFGVQTYVFTRTASINPADPIYQLTLADPVMHGILFSQAPDPSRVLVFASIGNSNNNVVVERQSGKAFNRQRSFVISTDAGIAREVSRALAHAGVSAPDEVFNEPVSPQVARLGLDAKADDFMTVIRYAQPNDKAAGDRWRQQIPLAILRVRDKNAKASEPWPKPVYDRKTAYPEFALKPDLAKLIEAVKHQWKQPNATVGQFASLQLSLDLIGQHCLARPMNCLGDTQDADYQVSPSLVIDDGTVVAVAGTLGTETANATYVGLSVNWLAVLEGVVNISDTDLKGSAARFAPVVGNTGKLYVQYFARDCTGIKHCQPITEQMVPKGNVVEIIQRNYVVPGTTRGPDPNKLLNPVAIILQRSSFKH